jgi:signal transduction histidine kinase
MVRRVAILLCLPLLGGLAAAPAPSGPSDADHAMVVIDSATLFEGGSPGAGRKVALPLHRNRDSRSLQTMRLTAEFELSAAFAADWQAQALLTGNMQDGGRLLVNGMEISEVSTNTAAFTVRHTRPYLFNIPKGVLRAGRNTLTREWAVRENVITSPRMVLGQRRLVAELFDSHYFWQNTMAKLSVVLAGSIALILLGLYWQNRSARHYLWVGGSALGYCILNFSYFLPPVPAWLFVPWHLLLYGGTGAFAVGAWHYLLYDVNAGNLWYSRFSVAWWLLFLPAYLAHFGLTGLSLWPEATPLWHYVLAALGAYPVATLTLAAWQHRRPRHLVYLSISLLAMGVGSLDAAILSGKQFAVIPGYATQAVAPAWFICVCFILVSDFTRSLRAQREQQLQLALQLEAQKQELARLYSLERITQEKQAAAVERARIMQDMHDGLGSQLVSSLAMAQGGELTQQQTYELLRSCIDDLRLAIDTSTDSRDSLALALGNLRFRMEPRLKAAGVTLKWQTRDLADDLPLPVEKQLPILRVIQETITNTLKHAQAKTLSVNVSSTATELEVEISDDGQGFDVQAATQTATGKGLNSLDKRARVLGASLRIESSSQGTRTRLTLPLTVKT